MTPLSETAKHVLAILSHYPEGRDEIEVSRELIGHLDSRDGECLAMIGGVNAAMFRLRKRGFVVGGFMAPNVITDAGLIALTGV